MKIAISLLLACAACGAQTLHSVTNLVAGFTVSFQQTFYVPGFWVADRIREGNAGVDPMEDASFAEWREVDDSRYWMNDWPSGDYFFDGTNNYVVPNNNSMLSVPLFSLDYVLSNDPSFWANSDARWSQLITMGAQLSTATYTNIVASDFPDWVYFVSQDFWQGGDVWVDFDASGIPQIREGAQPSDFGKYLSDSSINPSWIEPLSVHGKGKALGHSK